MTTDQENINDEYKLPPRKSVHPSVQGNFTKWFYRVLLVLFMVLTITLLIWGYQVFQDRVGNDTAFLSFSDKTHLDTAIWN